MRTAIDWNELLPMYEIREQREWLLNKHNGDTIRARYSAKANIRNGRLT